MGISASREFTYRTRSLAKAFVVLLILAVLFPGRDVVVWDGAEDTAVNVGLQTNSARIVGDEI